jgi:hypothetical protein
VLVFHLLLYNAECWFIYYIILPFCVLIFVL